MRKLTLLAITALVAGTIYAETTPGFSGNFEFFATAEIGKGKRHAVIGNGTGFKIALNGVVDEFTTVNAEISQITRRVTERIIEVEDSNGRLKGETETIVKDDVIITGKERRKVKEKDGDFLGKSVGELTDKRKLANIYGVDTLRLLSLNEFTMTTDITGALGFADSPVGVSLTLGKTSLAPASFHKAAKIGYLDPETTDSYYGFKFAVTIVEKVKVITGIYPTTYFGERNENRYSRDGKFYPAGAVDLQLLGLIEGLNLNLFFTIDPHRDDDDSKTHVETREVGLTAGYTGLDSWAFGLNTSYDLQRGKKKEKGETKVSAFDIGISAAYMHERSDTAIAFVVEMFPIKNESKIGTVTTNKTSPIEVVFIIDERFRAVPGVLDVVLSMKLPVKGQTVTEVSGKTTKENKIKTWKAYWTDEMSFDAGIEAYLGSVTYGLGYEHNQRNKYSPNGDGSRGIYFKAKASF